MYIKDNIQPTLNCSFSAGSIIYAFKEQLIMGDLRVLEHCTVFLYPLAKGGWK